MKCVETQHLCDIFKRSLIDEVHVVFSIDDYLYTELEERLDEIHLLNPQDYIEKVKVVDKLASTYLTDTASITDYDEETNSYFKITVLQESSSKFHLYVEQQKL